MHFLAHQAATISTSTELWVASRCLLNRSLWSILGKLSRLPLWTALQGRCAQSFLCRFPLHFLRLPRCLEKVAGPGLNTSSFWSHRNYFLGSVTISLAQLLLRTEPHPFFCLWTLIPVTRRPTWWAAYSRWSCHILICLFVCFERKKNPTCFIIPFPLAFMGIECPELREESMTSLPTLSSMRSFFSADCIFNLLQLFYGLENPLTEWWLFSWNGAACKAMVVINSAVM